MAQVMVTIDGKAYRMACEEGQEGHLTELAEGFDRYVGHLKTQFGEIGDLRLTVMAGIMVMDELSEVTRRRETSRFTSSSRFARNSDWSSSCASRDRSVLTRRTSPSISPWSRSRSKRMSSALSRDAIALRNSSTAVLTVSPAAITLSPALLHPRESPRLPPSKIA